MPAPPEPPDPRLVLVRHGSTPWSVAGRHTGRTDLDLTPEGAAEAARVRPLLAGRRLALVLVSPLQRARHTAEAAGLGDRAEVEPDLQEWDYGDYEGLTRAQIRERDPGWTIWTGPVPGGEQAADVAARADAVLARVAPLLDPLAAGSQEPTGDVVLVAHGHLLRVLTARWLGLAPTEGRLFALDPATISELGHEREARVIRAWNVAPPR